MVNRGTLPFLCSQHACLPRMVGSNWRGRGIIPVLLGIASKGTSFGEAKGLHDAGVGNHHTIAALPFCGIQSGVGPRDKLSKRRDV